MKFLFYVVALLFIVSCKTKTKEPRKILHLVDKGNDGWNALPIVLRDDSTFQIEHLSFGDPDIETGKYSISNQSISFFRGDSGKVKIIFDLTNSGCMSNAKYISEKDTIDMRVVFDSLFCNNFSK